MEIPYIDKAKCTGCYNCIDVCPVQVFAKDGKKVAVKSPDSCIQCRACEVNCPEKAIEVRE